MTVFHITNSCCVSLEPNYLVIMVTPALLRTEFKCLESLRSAWVIPRICLCLGPHMYLDWEERSCILLVSLYLCYVSAPSLIDILWMNQTKDSKDLKSVYSFIVIRAHIVPLPPFPRCIGPCLTDFPFPVFCSWLHDWIILRCYWMTLCMVQDELRFLLLFSINAFLLIIFSSSYNHCNKCPAFSTWLSFEIF